MDLYARITTNGNLEIYFEEIDREEIQEMMENKTDLDILFEGFEHYYTNGSYHPFDAGAANPFVGMTDAPCVAESMDFDDDGEAEINGAFWYFGDYMIDSFIEKMLENGSVVFTLAQ